MHEVTDDPAAGRLELVVDGHRAEIVYRDVGRRMVVLHTGVPEELAGRGIGGELMRAVIDRAGRGGLTVVPICPFARTWMTRHPDEVGDVDVDWDAKD